MIDTFISHSNQDATLAESLIVSREKRLMKAAALDFTSYQLLSSVRLRLRP
jgi:hypothetical protein